ncbi:MAG: redoxin domain-containing protein [Deltaproteobacteria bacterium]|nr:redoxin domain-containing protein [Deltaproteobacteria bacterium]
MRQMGSLILAAVVAVGLALACGESKPPPPPVAGLDAEAIIPLDAGELPSGEDAGPGLDAQDPGLIRQDAGFAYPPGPYGTAIGDTVDNIVLSGFPKGTKSTAWSTVSLADFHDPDGTKGTKTLFVDVSARWCSVCKGEAPELTELCRTYAAKGLACYTSLFQDESGNPARRDDVSWWMTTYGIEFAITVDPGFQWGLFFPEEATPFHAFIDARTMKIVGICMGADDGDNQCIHEGMDDFTRCPTAVCPVNQRCNAQGQCVRN